MNLIQEQILITLTVIIWFDVFGLHRKILDRLGIPAWRDLESNPFKYRIFACYFCTSFWIGTLVCVVNYFITSDLVLMITGIGLNAVISRILDLTLGYESIKGK